MHSNEIDVNLDKNNNTISSESYPNFNDSQEIHNWDRTSSDTRTTPLLEIDQSINNGEGPVVGVNPDDRFLDKVLTQEEIHHVYSRLTTLDSAVASHNQFYQIEYVDSKLDVSLHLISKGVEWVYETLTYVYSGKYILDCELFDGLYGFYYFKLFLNWFLISSAFANTVAPIFNDSVSCVVTVSSVVSDIIMKYSFFPSYPTMILRHYPEIVDYYNTQSKNQAKTSLLVSQVFTTVIFSEYVENFFTGFFSLLLVFLSWVLFLALYYSPYSNVNESESIIDQEYLAVSKLTEGEKEIGSVDDLLLPILMLVYIFGWFFATYFYTILSRLPELVFCMYLLPALWFIIFFMPFSLLKDFGIVFGMYLRGSSKTSSIAVEIGYDYMSIFVFFIRLAVQSVRLILMTFAFASYHDLIIFYSLSPKYFLGNESFFEYPSNYGFVQLFNYYLFVKVPGNILYLIYEIIHTFFLLTGQFISFFAMVFWLFLFLYSCFLIHRVENFFSDKREKRKKLFNAIYKVN